MAEQRAEDRSDEAPRDADDARVLQREDRFCLNQVAGRALFAMLSHSVLSV